MMLAASFVLISYLSKKSHHAVTTYPHFSESDCEVITAGKDMTAMKKNALMDYSAQQELEARGYQPNFSQGNV